jgi:membrane-bound serine protease (ClpP class)
MEVGVSGLDAEVLAWIWVLGLFVLGFALVVLDIFVTPGMDIVGVLGLLCICAGVAYAYVELGTASALAAVALGLMSMAALVWAAFRRAPWRRLVLDSAIREDQATGTSSSRSVVTVGEIGESLTPLRPSGRAQFAERSVDVVTDGDFLDKGTAITVLGVSGRRVVVQRRSDG